MRNLCGICLMNAYHPAHGLRLEVPEIPSDFRNEFEWIGIYGAGSWPLRAWDVEKALDLVDRVEAEIGEGKIKWRSADGSQIGMYPITVISGTAVCSYHVPAMIERWPRARV